MRSAKTVNNYAPRPQEWTVGYTGHIPRLRYGFGLSNSAVSAAVFSASPHHPASPAAAADGVQRVAITRSGQRQLAMAAGTTVPGTGFLSTARPIVTTPQSDVYAQGTRVRLQVPGRAPYPASPAHLNVPERRAVPPTGEWKR